MMLFYFMVASAILWISLLIVPWQPWRTREQLEALVDATHSDFSNITALVPARNEAACIDESLSALAVQGRLAKIIVIDDQSDDGTARLARGTHLENLVVVAGSAPPLGWSGKLWALEQGLSLVDSERVLLLDADIRLQVGTLAALNEHMDRERLDMVSLMAELQLGHFWGKLLLPPFIYFFKLIYPFSLANNPRVELAAAAGGCILIKTSHLRAIGGFGVLRNAIIDDCSLAKEVKKRGGKIWLGLTHSATAIRPYSGLSCIWNMVARTAFTQLHYSLAWLLLCSALLVICFILPVAGLFYGDAEIRAVAVIALTAMFISYSPTLLFYGRPLLWVTSLPIAAVLYLAMTWTSAFRYWRGEKARWKDRSYTREPV